MVVCLFTLSRLHNYLLQPRGVRQIEDKPTKNTEQKCALKAKKVVGNIRVEGEVSQL